MDEAAPPLTLPVHALNRLLSHLAGLRVVRNNHPAMRYVRHFPATQLQYLLPRLFGTMENLRFIQIGANDGQQSDPIAALVTPLGWRGVMLEPLPDSFAALQARHSANPRVRLLNAALDTARGRRLIHNIVPPSAGLPPWIRGLASFSLDRVQAAAREVGLGAEAVRSVEVETVTWDDVWRLCPDGHCDLLLLDTEGHDLPLLRAAGLGKRRPRVIHFEHALATEAERLAAYGELIGAGYELATEGPDTTAWRPS